MGRFQWLPGALLICAKLSKWKKNIDKWNTYITILHNTCLFNLTGCFQKFVCLTDFEKYSGCLPTNIVLELHFFILDFSALCFFMFFTINTIISWSAVNPGELCGPKKRRITRVHSVSQGVTKNCHFSDLGPAIMVELWPFKKKLENQSSSTHRAHLK